MIREVGGDTKGETFDLVVLGSGPAGQKAAIQGAKAGAKVVVIEHEPRIGGACVHSGTIPSKTLRETALAIHGFRQRSGDNYKVSAQENTPMSRLMQRLDSVVRAHETFMSEQLARNGVRVIHGRAAFRSAHEIEVRSIDDTRRIISGRFMVIATGSRPRAPSDVPIDHAQVLDSDSILTMHYLPASLTILGAGVIGSEYASIFAALGVRVVLVDKADQPVAFLDRELTSRFVAAFEAGGGRFLGGRVVRHVDADGLARVTTLLDDGQVIETEKMLFALGRVANIDGLRIEAAGLSATKRGLLEVDVHCRTTVPHIYAVGDVIGPPALASAAMEQGRRAVCHALGLSVGNAAETLPLGIYTIPEMASVGLSEAQAIERFGSAIIGRAPFSELARGQIAGATDGLLRLVSDPEGRRILGVQIIGEGATELIHVGQMALLCNTPVDVFIDNIFNFPTLAEGYRVAALDIAKSRARLSQSRAAAVGPSQ